MSRINVLSWVNNVQRDKYVHVTVSAIIACFVNNIFSLFMGHVHASVIAFLSTIIIGIAKEVYDKTTKKGNCEWQDFIADVVGALIGSL